MKKEKLIVFGDPAFTIKELRKPDIYVTRFNVNISTMEAEMTYEIGLSVNRLNISVFTALESGLINLNVLNKIV